MEIFIISGFGLGLVVLIALLVGCCCSRCGETHNSEQSVNIFMANSTQPNGVEMRRLTVDSQL